MANTYTLIASSTASSSVSSISFASIPSTYTDLVLKLSVRSDYAATQSRSKLQINSSTTGYTTKLVYGDGASTSSASSTDYITYFYSTGSSATASTFANSEIYLPNYAGSNNKSTSSDSVTENNGTTAYATLAAGLLSNTAAISSLTITDANGGNFVQYSTAYLYGVNNA
jgi:hypothetical protein